MSKSPKIKPLNATMNRKAEIIRLNVMGHKNKAIARELGVTPQSVSDTLRKRGAVKQRINLSEMRDMTVGQMQEGMLRQRHEAAQMCWNAITKKLEELESQNELNTKFAFDVLDRTEGVASKKIEVKQAVGVFSLDDLKRARTETEGIIDL